MAAPVVVVAADQVLQKMPCVYDSSQVMNETENKYMGKEFPGLLLHHLSSQACEKKYGIERNVCLSGKEVGNCKLHVQGQQGGNWMELQRSTGHGISQMPTWRLNAFCTRKGEPSKRHLSMDSGRQMSDPSYKATLPFRAYMVNVKCKGATIFVRKLWDPGIWRCIIRELVLQCGVRSCALRTCILYPGIQIQSGKEVQGEIIHCGNLAGKMVALYMPIDAQDCLVRLTVEHTEDLSCRHHKCLMGMIILLPRRWTPTHACLYSWPLVVSL